MFIMMLNSVFFVGCSSNTKVEMEDEGASSEKMSLIQQDPDNEGRKISLYFVNKEKTKLVEYEMNYPVNSYSKKQNIKNMLIELQAGLEKTDLLPSIPSQLVMNRIDYNQEEQSAVIDFDKQYEELNSNEAVMLRASIVLSLTELDYINSVKLTVDGQPILDSNGKAIGQMTKQDIVIGVEDYLLTTETHVLTLYFANEDRKALKTEKRIVDIEGGKPLQQVVMEELMKGPKSDDLNKTIPEATKIIEIIVKDGICYVDLSDKFLQNPLKGGLDEKLTLYSIVNSLTELSDINQVQFLIQGEKQQKYKSIQEFNKLFSRDLDMVEKK